jgi:hypothetical protein
MQAPTLSTLNLTPFRRRIRLLCVWHGAALGGGIGSLVALAVSALDFFAVRYTSPKELVTIVVVGAILGIGKGLLERLTDTAIARSLDRRGRLEDRLTTASEIAQDQGGFAQALHQDATQHLSGLHAKTLYRLRLSRWHGVLVLGLGVSLLLFLGANTPLLKTGDGRKEAAELKQIAKEVEQVTKPTLEEAKKVNAAAADKELARRLELFTAELNKSRLNKQEALLKANQLAEEAKKLQQPRAEALAKATQLATTAAQKLEKQAQLAQLDKSESRQLAEKEAQLQQQIAELEKQMNSPSKDGKPLSKEERNALEKKLGEAKKQLEQVQLSKKAQDFLQKLQAMSEYKEAQELLAKLQQEAQAQAAGAPSEMTPEQIAAAAQRLEELAKQFDTDEKMKELAKQLLEAAKKAKPCKGGNCAGGLMGAFGLGNSMGRSMGGFSLGGMKGAGAPSNDKWVGAHGELNKTDKSSLLNVKLEDRVIQSQIGDKGAQTYTETLGPAQLGNRSQIPYQSVLPKYQKSAETALNKGDIPPRLRGKVRDYFDSLRK